MAPNRITPEIVQQATEDPNILGEYLLDLFKKNRSAHSAEGNEMFIKSLPYGLQNVNWLVLFDSEILNGGIRQFFWNHSNWEVDETQKALE
jgi:hypothetical protein